jgi:glycogen debranching enzyme
MLTILQGATFCVSAETGDLDGGLTGVFAEDTRFLSRLVLGVDGRSPLLLDARRVEYFSAAHYLRNATTERVPRDTISLARERFISRGLAERLILRNESDAPLSFVLAIELAADFVDVITLKAHDFAVGAGEVPIPLPHAVGPRVVSSHELVLDDPESDLVTWVTGTHAFRLRESTVEFDLALEPGERWELVLEVVPGRANEPRQSAGAEMRFGREGRHVRAALASWQLRVPQLATSNGDLERVYQRSLADLASLRLRGFGTAGELPAAGMPWFMTVFGRDTLITSLQTLLFGPELAVGALTTLAELQATHDDPGVDAEPGKIPHEVRRGKAATTWFPIYYGSADATPLFLILLSEVWRWTRDDRLAHTLREPALAALGWIDSYGDRDGDGFVEYERRTPYGLENQSWKDSGDSQRFHDGRYAVPPICAVEIQGYVYDAKRRLSELARDVWQDGQLAARLDDEAKELARRFDASFWLDERQAYALALDGDKTPVDAVCSNMGHLLWSGIVPPERQAVLARQLTSGPLWSGWGVRTMSADEAAYNPLSYHNGTVWPHDTSLVAWGLERNGFRGETGKLCQALFDAARWFDGSLPEVFAGFGRQETPFPVSYPTASRPQAWAAAAPILCLQLLLGLHPDPETSALATRADSAPHWLGNLTLSGVRALGSEWIVTVQENEVRIRAA